MSKRTGRGFFYNVGYPSPTFAFVKQDEILCNGQTIIESEGKRRSHQVKIRGRYAFKNQRYFGS